MPLSPHFSLMAQAALSVSAILLPFNRGAKHWGKLFPSSRRFATKLSMFDSSRNKGIRFVTSGVSGTNYGSVETTQSETVPRFYKWPDKKRPRVCILGGGFGGLYTALRLESLVWPDDKKPQVLLVDQSDRFVFKPMLYELLSGEVDPWEIAPRFSDLLANTSVQFFQGTVKLLYPSDHLGINGHAGSSCGGTVHLGSGLLIEYDWLVLALGAEVELDVVPGAVELALPFSTLEDAYRVDDKLKTLERKNFGKDSKLRVAVVGCGYAGVELAATLSERLQNKGIVQAINVGTTICPSAPPGNREAAMKVCHQPGWRHAFYCMPPTGLAAYKVLSSRNVQLLLGYFVRRIRRVGELEASEKQTESVAIQDIKVERDPEKLILELQPAERGLQGQTLEVDLVLWTVGSKPSIPKLEPRDKPLELPLNARGQAETDETLRVKGHPRIFALGDSSCIRDSSGRLLPATAQVAFQQADFTGWNLWAAINDRPLLPFRFQNLGEMMTLGRSDAAISPSFIEGLTLEGPIGHTARKLAYLIRLPTDEHRLKVGISWFTKSAIDSVASLQSSLIKVLSGES